MRTNFKRMLLASLCATALFTSFTPHVAKAAPEVLAEELYNYQGKQSTVNYVTSGDADTVIVKRKNGKKVTVRLLGVDAPELRSFRITTPQIKTVAVAASLYTRHKLQKAKKIELVYDNEVGKVKESPITNRTLAYIYVDGKDLGELLLKKGYALVRPQVDMDAIVVSKYKREQARAKSLKLGIWVKKDTFTSQ